MGETLTEQQYWDQHWEKLKLPVANTLAASSGLTRAIVEEFERATASRPPKTVLEIGGAPGGFLAYFASRHGAEIHALDYSEAGCRKTEENFRLLGQPVQVHQQDVFAVGPDFPRFDLVYSLGLIEHFAETQRIIKAHADLVKPGGLLILGVPHFVRVFWPVLSLFAPRVTQGHNRQALSPSLWTAYEQPLGLTPIRKAYVGGFDICLMHSVIGEEYAMGGGRYQVVGRALLAGLRLAFRTRQGIARRMPGVANACRVEGSWVSAYAMGTYVAGTCGEPLKSK